jgi:hypothetical protein
MLYKNQPNKNSFSDIIAKGMGFALSACFWRNVENHGLRHKPSEKNELRLFVDVLKFSFRIVVLPISNFMVNYSQSHPPTSTFSKKLQPWHGSIVLAASLLSLDATTPCDRKR